MKKIIASLALCATLFIGFNAYCQQGKWAGLVKYKMTWTGNVPQQVPQEWQTKIYNNLEGNIDLSTLGLGKTIVAALIARMFFFSNNYPAYRSRTLIITPLH